jgi:hypothetical protein
MDHAQGRAFHHHLARAIMHLNYLAGLLPFFEPSIEWEDPSNEHDPRSGRSNPASRNLHTFVPLPVSSTPPTMISHGSIPTRMVLNPEPNLRPLTIAHHPREDEGYRNVEATARNPTSNQLWAIPQRRFWKPPSGAGQIRPVPDFPRATTRTTPVPVRSKQRSNPVDDPQPKKKQRSTLSAPESTARPPPLHIIAEIPPNGFNSDDSDEDAASDDHNLANEHSTTPPPGTSTPIEPTPNPTIRILQPADSARGHGSAPFRPWTDIIDHGNRLVPGYVVILRRAKCAGPFSNKCPTNTVRSRLIMNLRQWTKSLRQKKERPPQHSH